MADTMTLTLATPETLSRRERYRLYMKAFNPTASARELIKVGFLLADLHRSLYQTLAARADLEPGCQQLVIGGIGSGKTTELRMAEDWLSQQELCIPVYIDVTAETDLSDLKSGALLASFGLHLLRLVNIQLQRNSHSVSKSNLANINKAIGEIHEFALGKTIRTWVEDVDQELDYVDSDDDVPSKRLVVTTLPGKLNRPVPRLMKDIQSIRETLDILLQFLTTINGKKRDVVVLFDGLDRLIIPSKFWSVAHQDLRILKQLKVSVLATAPLAVLYEDREIAEHFDRVHHLATLSADGPEQSQLESVLLKRGGDLLLNKKQMSDLCAISGGVLRDLITLARDAAEEAYIAGEPRVRDNDIEAAATQLGTSYLRGLNTKQRSSLKMLDQFNTFDPKQHGSMELLATRRVLEYSATDFRVHPALLKVLSELGGK